MTREQATTGAQHPPGLTISPLPPSHLLQNRKIHQHVWYPTKILGLTDTVPTLGGAREAGDLLELRRRRTIALHVRRYSTLEEMGRRRGPPENTPDVSQ